MQKIVETLRILGWKINIALILCSAFYPLIFMYAVNIKEIEASILFLPMLSIGFATLIFFVLFLFFGRNMQAATLSTCLFFLIFFNYALIEKCVFNIFSKLNYWHVLPIIMLLYLFCVWLFHKKISIEICRNIQICFGIAIFSLIFINFITIIPQEIKKIYEQKQIASVQGISNTQKLSDNFQPNIYLLIFDEYASFNQLENYFNFDNSEFKNFLERNKFMVSEKSRNESTSTKVVLTNLINLDYVAEENMDDVTLANLRQEPYLFQFLMKQGYTLKGIGNTEWLGIKSDISVSRKAATIEGDTFITLLLKNTMLYPLCERVENDEQKIISTTLNQLKSIETSPNQVNFILGYTKSPHQPFLYDKNGRETSPENYHNWNDCKYYLGQLQYITKQIEIIIENIIKNDPASVIILCSDHGARLGSNSSFEIKTTILNAVYFQGEPLPEVLDQSSVNTMRIILQKLGYGDFATLEVPNVNTK